MGEIVFVLGGARSGKSSFALAEASKIAGRKKAFVATMEPGDSELEARISTPRMERGPEWETFEAPLDISGLLGKIGSRYDVILLDCLTLWLSNRMLLNEGRTIGDGPEGLIKALEKTACPVFAVSNEVGMGIVPGTGLGRAFRDEAGRLNRLVAAAADRVYLVVAGIPQRIK